MTSRYTKRTTHTRRQNTSIRVTMLKLPCVLLLRRSFPFVLYAWVGRRKPQFILFHMKQHYSASKSKRKISHDSAHRSQNKAILLPIHCEFMFRAPIQKSNFARRNAIARIIDNRGRSQTQGGVRKNLLVAPKSQETEFGGRMPHSRQMSKVLRFMLRFAHAEEENNAI